MSFYGAFVTAIAAIIFWIFSLLVITLLFSFFTLQFRLENSSSFRINQTLKSITMTQKEIQ